MLTNSWVKVKTLVEQSATALSSVYPEHEVAYRQAWFLVEHVTGLTRAELISAGMISLSTDQNELLKTLVIKISQQSMPLAYALGEVPFLDLMLDIKPPLLIPRPETESWTAHFIETIHPLVKQATADKPFTVLDLCTGSGCIALAITAHFKHDHVSIIGIDNNPQALACAEKNRQAYELTKCSFISSDLYAELASHHSYDSIVANPPYIQEQEFPLLDPSVRNWEDYNALVSGPTGLELIQRVIKGAAQFLRTDYGSGHLWCEIGHKQGPAVKALYEASGFHNIVVMQDSNDKDRVVKGTYYGTRSHNR